MKILFFGTTYSDIYELWRAHLHYKHFYLASSVQQARFYLENEKINLIIINHDFDEFNELIEAELFPFNTPIIIVNNYLPWANLYHQMLKQKHLIVSSVPMSNPKAIVNLIKMKGLHGMSYTG